MSPVGHQHYLDVASARDLRTFHRRLVGFADSLGFPLVNAALLVEQPGAPDAIVCVREAPNEFLAETTSVTSGRRDPVWQRLKTLAIPFVYDQSTYVQAGAGDLWETQAPYGYRTGVSIALHMTGGRHFLMGVDRAEALPNDPDKVMELMAHLQLLAAFSQETALRLMLPLASVNEAIPELTAREQEILRWTRDGKSTAVIAAILSISERTVNYHATAANAKLGVSSRHQAAAKANLLGLL